MAVTPGSVILPQTTVTTTAVCTTAKSTYADATNAVRLVAAGSVPNGGLLKHLSGIARASITDCQLQLYRSADSGVTLRLADSALLPSYTLAGSTAITKGIFAAITDDTPFRLGVGEELWVGIGINAASGVVFSAEVEAY